MNADRGEVCRDEKGTGWLIRIQVGEEVVRRHRDQPKDEATLRCTAVKIAADEGYAVDASADVFA